MKPLNVSWLGEIKYSRSHQLQKEFVKKRIDDEISDLILLLEHSHVITLGRGAEKGNVLVDKDFLNLQGFEVFDVERGGDVTYHGPGQLVGYPIIKLEENERDLHLVIRRYEEVLIRVLDDYGIHGKRIPPNSGVWVGEKKIAAIGVAVKRWVTYHGFALNISPDLKHFNYIIPCGIKGAQSTSLKELLGEKCPGIFEIKEKVLHQFCSIWGMERVNYEKEIPPLVKKTDSRRS